MMSARRLSGTSEGLCELASLVIQKASLNREWRQGQRSGGQTRSIDKRGRGP